MREITQVQFYAAADIFDLIDNLREQLTNSKTLEAKLILRRRISKLVADRRAILEMDDER